jgi:hypothetical protein
MMPGMIGMLDAERARLGDEVLVGIGVVEVLGDGRVGAGIDLALEVQQVFARALRLRMPFRIGRDLDAEAVAAFGADELDQLIGIAEFAGIDHARRQVAAQGDDAADAAAPNSASSSRMPARVEPMQDRCGAALYPAAAISLTTARVRSRVEPPAP